MSKLNLASTSVDTRPEIIFNISFPKNTETWSTVSLINSISENPWSKEFSELSKALNKKNFLDIELIILLMLISFIPPYPYFKGVQMYIAYILILSNLNQFLDRVYDNKKSTNYLVKS